MPDILPQLGLGGAALLIFAICAAYLMLRGIARMLAAVLMLCGSAWIAFQIWQKAPAWAIAITGSAPQWITTGLPIIAFIAAFIVFKKVTGFFMRPFSRPADSPPRSWPVRGILAALALVPASAFWLTGATFAHHAGTIAELKSFAEKPNPATPDQPENPQPAFSFSAIFQALRPAIAAAIPQEWLKFLDPLADPDRLSLAKSILSGNSPEIDPATGQPIPKAIAVDENDLTDLARDGRYSTLLHHPELKKALENSEKRTRLGGRHRRF